ncbi:MAG: undecaprenyl-phosphate glucose phosphotransferase [Oscillospiraceae bacterium]|nr:undecaprenyl-phosphate glucose phosphotransferase [Oscillospiraceae bacterium]
MIKENQALLNRINVVSDGVLSYLMLPIAFYIRFYIFPNGIITIPLRSYLAIGVVLTLIQLFTYAGFGLYQHQRTGRLRSELRQLFRASLLDFVLLLSWLFLQREEHYSRMTLALFLILSVGALATKRVFLRRGLRRLRGSGKNLKHVLLIGSGDSAKRYLAALEKNADLGYRVLGYIAPRVGSGIHVPYLGGLEALDKVLEQNPDEVVSAIEMEDYRMTPQIIHACEQTGVKLSIIPFYADYMPAHPQFDDIDGIPLMNIRRIPLDNFANAFVKRLIDILGSAAGLVLLSPLLLACAVGVRFSSPGPILFRQERIGLNKKPFYMHKFRSMRVNDRQDTAWSTQKDSRRTRFGSFLRKYSLDELVQLYDVLIGKMSLVGPRPEIPHFVDQFKDEIPLYMIRHQVRPGITGWAQVNGFRGDTPIRKRVEYDIYYIENWSIWFDIQILLATVFRGKFVNDEEL